MLFWMKGYENKFSKAANWRLHILKLVVVLVEMKKKLNYWIGRLTKFKCLSQNKQKAIQNVYALSFYSRLDKKKIIISEGVRPMWPDLGGCRLLYFNHILMVMFFLVYGKYF